MKPQLRLLHLFVLPVLLVLPTLASAQTGQDADYIPYKQNEISDISDLSARNEEVLQSKRDMVVEIAKRNGTRHSLDASPKEVLGILQGLLDDGAVTPGQAQELQAMGVVLGDLFARKPELKWVSFEDELGKSLAIRIDNTENVLFPVTMISRLVEAGIKVNVEAIYNKGLAIASKTEHDENLEDIK